MTLSPSLRDSYHALPIDQVITDFDSDLEQGLSAEVVSQRHETHGWNELSFKSGKPAWLRFLLQFHPLYSMQPQ